MASTEPLLGEVGGAANLQAIEGVWIRRHRRGKFREVIKDGHIHWDDGPVTEITADGTGNYTTKWQGRAYHARIVDGNIVWDDGDVWGPFNHGNAGLVGGLQDRLPTGHPSSASPEGVSSGFCERPGDTVEGARSFRKYGYQAVNNRFEDVQRVGLSFLGIEHCDDWSMARLDRGLRVSKSVAGPQKMVSKAVGWHNWHMRTRNPSEALPHVCPPRLRECEAVFFRGKEVQDTNNEPGKAKNFPQSLNCKLEAVDYELSFFTPVKPDFLGSWTGWALKVDDHLTVHGELGRTFPIPYKRSDERIKYFAWSYPVKLNSEKVPEELREFVEYGGFMGFCSRRGQRPRELGAIYTTIPVEPREAHLTTYPPMWLTKEEVYKQWDKLTELPEARGSWQGSGTAALKNMGAKYFCWVSPGDFLGKETCPLGFPGGGFLFLGNFGTVPDEERSQGGDLDRTEQKQQWWNDHVELLRQNINRNRWLEDELLQALEGARVQTDSITVGGEDSAEHSETPPENSWKPHWLGTTLSDDEKLLVVLKRARYFFRLREPRLLITNIYFGLLWFRFPFMFLMITLLLTATFLGALMQTMFCLFRVVYDDQEATVGLFIIFGLLPVFIVLCALLVAQLWDLILSSFSPPYFVPFRARLWTICMAMGWWEENAGHRLMQYDWVPTYVDVCFMIGLEVLPIFGATYNAFLLNVEGALTNLPHFFYLGHQGKGDTIWSGYLNGMILNCVIMMILSIITHVWYCVLERRQTAETSLRFLLNKITDMIETYDILPMRMRYHSLALQVAFDSRDPEDGVDNHPPDQAFQWKTHHLRKYHESRGLQNERQQLNWCNSQYCLTFFLLVPWALMVLWCYKGYHMQIRDELVWFGGVVSLIMAIISIALSLTHNFPTLSGPTYRVILVQFCLIQAFLFFGRPASGYFGESATAGQMTPMMEVNGPCNGTLNCSWPDPGEAQPYPVCKQSWGNHDSSISALDLAALSSIVYEQDRANITQLLKITFGPGPHLEHFTSYMDMPRWITVRFPAGWKDQAMKGSEEADTLVVAVKGTSTLQDAYLDTDFFTTIQVLQYFEFFAPVLKIMPSDLVQWMLKMVKLLAGGGGRNEIQIWEKLETYVSKLQKASNQTTAIVLTGHSLGGGLAGIVAAKRAIPALVWSAPGTLYSQGFFSGNVRGSVSEERMQRNVVNVMPDNDAVPRVDVQQSVVQRIQCFRKNHMPVSYFLGTSDCHKITKSACEVWRVCGDPMKRDFSETCQQFVAPHELGIVYPVLNGPILFPAQEEQ